MRRIRHLLLPASLQEWLAKGHLAYIISDTAVDGTKMKANASRHKAMSYKRMVEKEQQLKEQIEELLEKAKATDEAETDEVQLDIPAEFQRREKRLAAIRTAKERF